jgi:RNA polymerase sigma factor (TIGR02999 family)
MLYKKGQDIMDSGTLNNEITSLIIQWTEGDKLSEEKLFALTYKKFKDIAREAKQKFELKSETDLPASIIDSTTAIVHDAYLKLAPGLNETIASKKQFYLLVSKVMRHILVDHYRKNSAAKRQSDKAHTNEFLTSEVSSIDYIAIDQAIECLTKVYPRQAETIQLRYFHGLKNKEIAALHQISESLVDKDLKFSKSWMQLYA